MLLDKMIKYASSLGMDPNKLLDMTVFEAIEEIDKIKSMWKELIGGAK